MLATKSSTLCLLFCTGLVAADVKTVFDDDGKDYNEDSVIKSVNIHNSLMTIVSCDSLEAVKPDRRCNVTQTDMQSKKNPVQCEFVLNDFLNDLTGHPFTANKAILISQTGKNSEEHYAKYTVINFTDCKTNESKIKFESLEAVRDHLLQNKDAILINEDDTFDVLYNEAKVCGNKVCRLTFDAQGNKVRGPIVSSFVPRVGSIRRVKKVPSTPNFIAVEVIKDRSSAMRFLLFSLIKPDEQVVIKEYMFHGEFNNDHVISASHGSIRVCSQGDKSTDVDCEMFNENGEKIVKISIPVGQKVNSIAVENLAERGFLLLVEGENTDSVVKFEKSVLIGVAELPRRTTVLSKNYSKYESYVVFENNEYCVTRRGFGFTKLKVLKQCFGESDFNSTTRTDVIYYI